MSLNITDLIPGACLRQLVDIDIYWDMMLGSPSMVEAGDLWVIVGTIDWDPLGVEVLHMSGRKASFHCEWTLKRFELAGL